MGFAQWDVVYLIIEFNNSVEIDPNFYWKENQKVQKINQIHLAPLKLKFQLRTSGHISRLLKISSTNEKP